MAFARVVSVLLPVMAASAFSGHAQAASHLRPVADGRQTAAAGVISTLAGGVGGPAKGTRVALSFPCGAFFAAGQVLIGDDTTVRALNSRTGRLTTPAGVGVAGPLGDGGPAARAALSRACAVAADHSRNLVIADTVDQRIRVVAAQSGIFYGRSLTAGDIYTVAGNGTKGFSGDGGPATSAEFSFPGGVAVDGAGNLVIADTSNSRVRVVAVQSGRFYGQAMTAGDIYTVAGNGADGFSGDGGPATGAELDFPQRVAVDSAGNLVIADTENHRVRVVAVQSGRFYGQAMTAGDIYTVAGNGTFGFSGDGGPATEAELSDLFEIAVDGVGNLVISDPDNSRIRVVAVRSGTFYGQAMTAGDIYTAAGNGTFGFSGDGGPAIKAELDFPDGVAVGGAGNLVIADTFNRRVRVVAVQSGTFYGRAMTAGNIYTVGGNGTSSFSGDSRLATRAQLSHPNGVTVDGAGNLVIADTSNQRIRIVAGRSGTFYGRAMTAGRIYSVAGNGTFGFSRDGGPATSAELNFPEGAAADGAGNLVIADTSNQRIRIVAGRSGTFYGRTLRAGDIYTLAGNGTPGFSGDGGPARKAQVAAPSAVAVDHAANLVIADRANNRIRVIAAQSGRFYRRAMTEGHIYTVAGGGTRFLGDGGPATKARFAAPYSVVVDHTGNLVIADKGHNRIRVVAARSGRFYGRAMTAGDIYTVAGNGTPGFSGDGGRAIKAALDAPYSVAVDHAGNLAIADRSNHRIRVVAALSGTFYGKAMTAGHIYTVAGNGTTGFSGDGGPATAAQVANPLGVAASSAGNLVIADTDNSRIRLVNR
jgi:trimeric autotransporter adhesin